MHTEFYRTISVIVEEDPRYKREAYEFVLRSLDETIRRLNRHTRTGADKHITGPELLQGVRQLALQECGLLARTVFEAWGVHATGDFGEIVFNLIDRQLLNKQDTDTREDFRDVYDFSVFEEDYEIPIELDTLAD